MLEDMLSGTRIAPPLNYAELASDSDMFKPCKEYIFLAPEDASLSDLSIARTLCLMRTRRVAEECTTEGVNRDELLRKVFQVVSDNTVSGFHNNLASVFGAIKRSGAERGGTGQMLWTLRLYAPTYRRQTWIGSTHQGKR